MILVTGANGITGHAVLRHLQRRGAKVRAMAGSDGSARALAALGAETAIADFRRPETVAAAMRGCDRVFHIPPRMQPDEFEISAGVIDVAAKTGIQHLVVLSVVCPHLEDISFHWTKMKVEAELFHRGQEIAYTILRPTNYMQNIEWQWETIEDGRFVLPYSADRRLTWVDAEEVGEAASRVLTEDGHERATYELAGRDTFLNRNEMSEKIGRALGREVRAVVQPLDEYMKLPRWAKRRPEEMQRLRTMFTHYERYGMPVGNSRTLSMLLGRPASDFDEFLSRFVALKRAGGRAWFK